MTFAKDIEKYIRELETQKYKLGNGIGALNTKKYFKILHKDLKKMGELLANEIEIIIKKNESGKYNILPDLNILRNGISLWHNYEKKVLKSEIPLKEREVAELNYNELDSMKVKMGVAVTEYPEYNQEIIQNQAARLLFKGEFSMMAFTNRIRANIERL